MAFNNVFDSSLVDYSGDFDKADTKYYTDKCWDIRDKVNNTNDIPGALKIKGYPIKYKELTNQYDSWVDDDEDDYFKCVNRSDSNLMVYDSSNGILYSAVVVTVHYNSESIDPHLIDLGMIVLEVPALRNKRFVFFGWGQNLGQVQGMNSLENLPKAYALSIPVIETAHKRIIEWFGVSNIGDDQYKLCTVKVNYL